jgi:DNA polymerase III delta prime subunit
MDFPPPHMVWYEPLNDRQMANVWNASKQAHPEAEWSEVDAAILNSIEGFSEWFEAWTTRSSQARVRILLVWHAHCLSSSCQQMLRRSMEKRSFKCRVWFHIEEPGTLQPAILSRCLVKRLPSVPPKEFKQIGTIPEIWKKAWESPFETEMELRGTK